MADYSGNKIASGSTTYVAELDTFMDDVEADINAIDEETGTWTPGLSDGTYSDAIFNFQIGTYSKRETQVTVHASIQITSLGSIVSPLRITGLPFVPSSPNANHRFSAFCGVGTGLNITAGNSLTGYIANADSNIYLQNWDSTTGITTLAASEFSATGSIKISATYTTT